MTLEPAGADETSYTYVACKDWMALDVSGDGKPDALCLLPIGFSTYLNTSH